MQGRRCDGGDGRREVECSGRSGRPGHPAVRGVRRIPNSSSLHSPASQSRVLSNIRRRRRTAVFEHLRAHNVPPPWKVRVANPRPHVTDPSRMRVSGRPVINGACAGATSSGDEVGVDRAGPGGRGVGRFASPMSAAGPSSRRENHIAARGDEAGRRTAGSSGRSAPRPRSRCAHRRRHPSTTR